MTEPARNAIRKALALRGVAAVRRVRHGRYEVESGTRAGHYHTVTHDGAGGRWACTCEAGRFGRPCWHQALVLVLKVEANGARVVAPASPADVIDVRLRCAA
jgi:hypothetical protein